MTLLTTEVVPGSDSRIVFAADRRISSIDGKPLGALQKIFEVPDRRAGIGYFGLATVRLRKTQSLPMQRWLTESLSRHSSASTLRDLASVICDELNRDVPTSDQSKYHSGLHLAGFTPAGVPEFWYIRNVDNDGRSLFGEYRVREDFQRRDVRRLSAGTWAIYRNGDIRGHVDAWKPLDEGFGRLLNASGFRFGSDAVSHARWVRFKLETIASFYERFCETSIIGRPVDAFVITLSGITRVSGTGARSGPRPAGSHRRRS
jgi:hypothetical protein